LEEAMTDEQFITQFEACIYPIESFRHRDHVRLAWLYLRADEPLAAIARFATSLKRFAASHGKGGLYHETITWAYLLLVRERMERACTDQTWEEFAAANEDLFAPSNGALRRYYRDETLASPLARRVFLFPDR
jgi:hypothetical protein